MSIKRTEHDNKDIAKPRHISALSSFSKSLSHLNHGNARARGKITKFVDHQRVEDEFIAGSSSQSISDIDNEQDESDDILRNGIQLPWNSKVVYSMTTDNPFVAGTFEGNSCCSYPDSRSLTFPFQKEIDVTNEISKKPVKGDFRSEYCDDDVSSVSMDSIRRQNPYWSLEMEQKLNPSPPVLISFKIKEGNANQEKTKISIQHTSSSELGNHGNELTAAVVTKFDKDTPQSGWELEWLRNELPQEQNKEIGFSNSKDNNENAVTNNVQGERGWKGAMLSTVIGSPFRDDTTRKSRFAKNKLFTSIDANQNLQGGITKLQLNLPPLVHSPWQSKRKSQPKGHPNEIKEYDAQPSDILTFPKELSHSNLDLQHPIGVNWLGRSKSVPAVHMIKMNAKPQADLSPIKTDLGNGLLIQTPTSADGPSPLPVTFHDIATPSTKRQNRIVERHMSVPKLNRINSSTNACVGWSPYNPSTSKYSSSQSDLANVAYESESPRSVKGFAQDKYLLGTKTYSKVLTQPHTPSTIRGSSNQSDEGSLSSKDDLQVSGNVEDSPKQKDLQFGCSSRLWERAKQSLVSPRRSSTYKLNIEKNVDKAHLSASCLI